MGRWIGRRGGFHERSRRSRSRWLWAGRRGSRLALHPEWLLQVSLELLTPVIMPIVEIPHYHHHPRISLFSSISSRPLIVKTPPTKLTQIRHILLKRIIRSIHLGHHLIQPSPRIHLLTEDGIFRCISMVLFESMPNVVPDRMSGSAIVDHGKKDEGCLCRGHGRCLVGIIALTRR